MIFDDFFEYFIDGEVDFRNYFDSLAPWYQHKNDKNVLFLTYERMRYKIKEAIIKIANFLILKNVDSIKYEQLVSKIIARSSFKNMRKNQQH